MDICKEKKRKRGAAAVTSSSCMPLRGPFEKPLGPLFFKSCPDALTRLCSFPSLSTPFLPRFRLSLFRSVQLPHPFTPTPSISSFVTAASGPHYPTSSPIRFHNCLKLLRAPCGLLLAFFPAGDESDRVGCVFLSSDAAAAVGEVWMTAEHFCHPIINILVGPTGNLDPAGFLTACTDKSVHCFHVRLHGQRPVLEHLRSKDFKSSLVHACQCPRSPQQAALLLASGEPFLVRFSSSAGTGFPDTGVEVNRLVVHWDSFGSPTQSPSWLSIEFSFHPKIFMIARSDAVFRVDFRSEKCCVSYLARSEMLAEKEPFVAFSRADADGFRFALASERRLYLFDFREPWRPVLQWVHHLTTPPCHIENFKLSDLRSRSRSRSLARDNDSSDGHPHPDPYGWASESGFGIILASFWTCEFRLFFYGPDSSNVSKTCSKSLSVWGLPSGHALLVSDDGHRASHLTMRQRFSKGALLSPADLQPKKVILGFSIIPFPSNIFADQSGAEGHPSGGFTLVKLLSTGNLESDRYYASWKPVRRTSEAASEKPLPFEVVEEYKFVKRFKYAKLEYLNAFINGNLTKMMASNKRSHSKSGGCSTKSFKAESHNHKLLSGMLKCCGFLSRPSAAAASESDVFREIYLPTSIYEVSARKLWTSLPTPLLLLGFSTYSECLKVLVDRKPVALEFLEIPDQPQLPPFFLRKPSCRGLKFSQFSKLQSKDGIVGPVIPLPILLNLCKFHKNVPLDLAWGLKGFSPEREIKRHCDESIAAARVLVECGLGSKHDRDAAVAASIVHNFESLHHQATVLDKGSLVEYEEKPVHRDENYATLVFRRPEKVDVPNRGMQIGEAIFDTQCPLALKVGSHPIALKSWKVLMMQYAGWIDGWT